MTVVCFQGQSESSDSCSIIDNDKIEGKDVKDQIHLSRTELRGF